MKYVNNAEHIQAKRCANVSVFSIAINLLHGPHKEKEVQ
jgi:hypothetical protein